MQGKTPYILPRGTMMGALAAYVSEGGAADFQPMGANMGMLPSPETRIRGKQERYQYIADTAVACLQQALAELQA